MRINDVLLCLLRVAVIAASALSAGSAPSADLQPLYVPFVFAESEVSPSRTFWRWESTLGFFNNSDVAAKYTLSAIHGEGARMGDPSICARYEPSIPPYEGWPVDVCWVTAPSRGVGFLEFRTSPGLIVQADVLRIFFKCGCYASLGCTPLPQGNAAIPAYRSLFPAGSTAISGAVELGQFNLPPSCAPANQQYRRRVNVTLFNAGSSEATFTVTALPAILSATPLSQQKVTVSPKDVIQLNSIPVPTEHATNLQWGAEEGNRVWITITADQPFLSYVSAVFDDPEPGALPFTVYPSYLQN